MKNILKKTEEVGVKQTPCNSCNNNNKYVVPWVDIDGIEQTGQPLMFLFVLLQWSSYHELLPIAKKNMCMAWVLFSYMFLETFQKHVSA
jgi:hypothetical protein